MMSSSVVFKKKRCGAFFIGAKMHIKRVAKGITPLNFILNAV